MRCFRRLPSVASAALPLCGVVKLRRRVGSVHPAQTSAAGVGGESKTTMFTVTCSEEIRRTPQAVFAFAGDYANDPLWRTGVLGMEYEKDRKAGIGVRTWETMRSMGSTAVTVGEITEYAPARTAFRSLSGPVPCSGSREFAASSTGTRFTYSLTLHPAGLLRVLEPILRLVFAKQVKMDLRRLKQLLEAQP